MHEDETPELIFEPIEILLTAFFGSVTGPARALKGIEAKIGDGGNIQVILRAQPALRLFNETIFVVVNADRTNGAFAEIEYLVAGGGALAGDRRGLVIAVEMVFICRIPEFHALEQLIGDVRIAGGGEEGREPIHAREDTVLDGIGGDMAGPAEEARNAEAAFIDRAFALREWGHTAIRPGEQFGAVVGGKDDNGVFVFTDVLEMLHHQTDIIIELGHAGFLFRPAVFGIHRCRVFG